MNKTNHTEIKKWILLEKKDRDAIQHMVAKKNLTQLLNTDFSANVYAFLSCDKILNNTKQIEKLKMILLCNMITKFQDEVIEVAPLITNKNFFDFCFEDCLQKLDYYRVVNKTIENLYYIFQNLEIDKQHNTIYFLNKLYYFDFTNNKLYNHFPKNNKRQNIIPLKIVSFPHMYQLDTNDLLLRNFEEDKDIMKQLAQITANFYNSFLPWKKIKKNCLLKGICQNEKMIQSYNFDYNIIGDKIKYLNHMNDLILTLIITTLNHLSARDFCTSYRDLGCMETFNKNLLNKILESYEILYENQFKCNYNRFKKLLDMYNKINF